MPVMFATVGLLYVELVLMIAGSFSPTLAKNRYVRHAEIGLLVSILVLTIAISVWWCYTNYTYLWS